MKEKEVLVLPEDKEKASPERGAAEETGDGNQAVQTELENRSENRMNIRGTLTGIEIIGAAISLSVYIISYCRYRKYILDGRTGNLPLKILNLNLR